LFKDKFYQSNHESSLHLCIYFIYYYTTHRPTSHAREGPDQAGSLVGGTAHVGNGQVIENAIVAFENGKLTLVVSAASGSFNQSGYEIIDISGKHVYPGLIAPDTKLGLEEIASVRATLDFRETGVINPMYVP
jgi:imidazolonepropionase-like amidohydrolase